MHMDKGFPGSSDGKKSACSAEDPGLIPGLRRSPGEGNGNPLQYSCPENSMDRGNGQATVHGVTKNWTQLRQLQEMGIPDHLTCLLRNLYAGQKATVSTGHGTTDWFQIGKGVC